jgi:hypothetical protein
LNGGGDIGRFAKYFARRVDHHLAAIEADARDKLRRLSGVPGVDL